MCVCVCVCVSYKCCLYKTVRYAGTEGTAVMGLWLSDQYWLLYATGVCVHMLLRVWVADQAAEISYGFSLDLRLFKLVPVNYCFYTKWMLILFSVGCGHYDTSGIGGCWTTFEDTWSGKCLGWMCLVCFCGGRNNVSVGKAGVDFV